MKQNNIIMKLNLLSVIWVLKSNYRLIHLVLLIILMLIAPVNFASGQEIKGKTFIVAPGGSDSNPGTKAQPMATLEAARDAARSAGTW